jgi:hypothetical protein
MHGMRNLNLLMLLAHAGGRARDTVKAWAIRVDRAFIDANDSRRGDYAARRPLWLADDNRP